MREETSAELPAGDRSSRPVVVIGERVGGPADEGYVKFTNELAAALGRRLPTVLDPGEPELAGRGRLSSGRLRRTLASDVRHDLARLQPRAVIFSSRSSVTLPGLLRAKLIRRAAGGAPVVMTALQPRRLNRLEQQVAMHMWPDLLLVGSESERRAVVAMGARADRIWGGVDLARFRPAEPGEKVLLRRRWKLPEDRPIVLHAGHLTRGRNLEYLMPLARSEHLTVAVAVAASRQREPESESIARALRQSGVTLFDGFLPRIEELYRLADCYIFTPSSDQVGAIEMPLSVLEALASGLPVASMRYGAIEEHFGATPAVISCDSAAELRQAVVTLLNSHPDPGRLADDFSWSKVAERVHHLLDGVVASRTC